MAQLSWIIVVLMLLLAVVIIRHWRQPGRRAKKLDLQARKTGPPSITPDDAERDERLLQSYGGGAARRISPTGPETFSYYRDEFERTMQAANGEAASLWKSITAMAFTGQAKASCGSEHLPEVSTLSRLIAVRMRLSEAEVEEIRIAGIVHDIGKACVPDHVRTKSTLLTAEEFEIIKCHAVWGAMILERLKEEGIARIVRHHHERFDGEGYPDHPKGEDIPLGARIVAVAECLDDMVSDHPYRRARTLEDVVAEIQRCSGTQFDPNVVKAFVG